MSHTNTLQEVLEVAKKINFDKICRMPVVYVSDFALLILKVSVDNYKLKNFSRDDWELIHLALHFSGNVRERLILERNYFNADDN